MAQKERSEYLNLRRKFEPTSASLVIIAESPPTSGLYFYDPDGRVSEPLFSALMKQLGIRPKTKLEGLREFQRGGWLLVDATYTPVNEHDRRGRDLVIRRDYPELCRDLKGSLGAGWKDVPLVLIKVNVCKLLEPRLKRDRFSVLNEGRAIFFPSNGQQTKFYAQFREIVPESLRKG
jgi:hypothetical protein